MKKYVIMTIVLLLAVSVGYAADFQRSARGGGMGFSFFMVGDDPSGALYNPSTLGYIKGWQTQLMYNKMADYDYQLSDENPYYGQFGFTYFRPDLGTFAINSVQSGSFSELTNIATVNHAVVSYGRQLNEAWSAGGSLKYLKENGFGERSAFDIDAGISFRAQNGFMAAAAFENISQAELSPDYLGVKEYLPRRGRIGTGYTYKGSTFQGSLLAATQFEESGIGEKQNTNLFNIGSEWWFFQDRPFSLGARGGYTFGEAVHYNVKEDYTGPSVGLSLNYRIGLNDLRLDYAWQAYPYETSDNTSPSDHYVAISFGWGGVPSNTPKSKPEPLQKPAPKADPETVKPQVFKEQPKDIIEAPLVDKDTDFKESNFQVFNVEMDVNDISSMDLKRIVFYIRPQQVIKTTSWKLYIFKAKIKSWSQEEADRWAIAAVDGKGVPPINVIWDGLDINGQYAPKGKYYYILTAVDLAGENYATPWFSFKLE